MMSAMHRDLWQALGPLEAEVDGYELETLELETPGFVRHSTTVVLAGGRARGPRRGRVVLARRPGGPSPPGPLPLRGKRTLAEWSALLDECELFPEETIQHAARDYRRWAYESALLDLALGQAGMTLGEAVGRSYSPVRFVVSSNARPRPLARALSGRRAQGGRRCGVGKGRLRAAGRAERSSASWTSRASTGRTIRRGSGRGRARRHGRRDLARRDHRGPLD